jgi:HSP90 family molecular chaperone
VALLNRYGLNTQEGQFSLKDYIALKKPTQDRIFFMFSPNRTVANDSPYVYPLTKAGVPVLIANTHID